MHDVRLMIYVEPPFKVSQNVFVFGSVMDGSQAVVAVMLASPYLPASLKITAHAAYINSYGMKLRQEFFFFLNSAII